MKVALIYGPWCLGDGQNGLDFHNLWGDRRGMSGSELGLVRFAQEIACAGHTVEVFTIPKIGTTFPQWPEPNSLGPGITLRAYEERVGIDGSYRAAVSWNEHDPLQCFKGRNNFLRVVSLQINTLVAQDPDLDSYVDLWLSPSQPHLDMILGPDGAGAPRTHMVGPWRQERPYVPKPERWRVVPDGCDPEAYAELERYGVTKVPGRCVWTSSPDRGLHWLLSIWPTIKRAVPEATLRVFYKLKPWLDHMLNHDPGEFDPSITEQIRRAHYIAEAIPRVQGMGVQFFDSVSRCEVVREQAEAMCFPYTFSPAGIWTEGFSCSAMECCAARAAPVLTALDALPHLYGDAVTIAPPPTSSSIHEFAERVVQVLTDEPYRNRMNDLGAELASRYTWKLAAKRLVEVLNELS